MNSRNNLTWLHRIVGDKTRDWPVAVSFDPLPAGVALPGKTVDDGLKALGRRQPASALATWRQMVAAGTTDPEAFLFASTLLRASRHWLEYSRPNRFEPSLFAEAMLMAQQACTLDPHWPDAWFAMGEWLLVSAFAEGMRRTFGTEKTFRLDVILREFQALGLMTRCLRQASELDDGRLAAALAAQVRPIWDAMVKSEVLGSAGKRATSATVRRTIDLLKRGGVDPADIRPTPSDAALIAEVRQLRSQAGLVIVVPPYSAFGEFEAMFAAAGLACAPGRGFYPSGNPFERWHARALQDRIALIHPVSLASQPWDWFGASAPGSVAIRIVGADESTLHVLMGALVWTTPPPARAETTDRIWYLRPAEI